MALTSRSQILPRMLVALAAVLLLASFGPSSFVPAPQRRPSSEAALFAAAAGVIAPLAAHADLPPLEDLPMEEAKNSWKFFGVEYTNILLVIPFAVTWAIYNVSTMVSKKELEGEYKTYFGAGAVPPEGYTNPLDPRMNYLEQEETQTDDDLYKQAMEKKKKKESASSAIV